MSVAFRDIETKLVHCGERAVEGAVCLPVFQSVTFASRPEDGYHDVRYIRLNNTPNHQLLHEKLAAIEGGEAALVTGSGMAAITTSLLTFLRAGDHLLAQDCLFGGTHGLRGFVRNTVTGMSPGNRRIALSMASLLGGRPHGMPRRPAGEQTVLPADIAQVESVVV